MGKLAEHWVEISARLDKFNAGMAQVEKRMTQVGKKMTAVGKTMTRYITLPIVAMGVLAVKAGADFEYAMTNAWAVTGEGEKALASMTAKAREMGATTIFSARQAAEAMYYMASAGWDSKKMAEAIKPTLDLAAATQSDLAFATEAVIASMNQFQITTKDTGRVTNVFAAAIMGSQATLEKLKISMTFIGPIAHSLGYEIEETTAALMGLYNAGFEASTAGTALRMALAKLALGTGATKEGLADLGLKIGDVNPEIYSMAEIIRKLEERGATATHVIKIFGVRAGPAMASLISQGADALDKFEEGITGTDAAALMAEKQLRTFRGSVKLLTSILNEASIQIFNVLGPAIKKLIDEKLRPAVKWFTELSKSTKESILKFAGLLALAGPAILIFGKLAIAITAMSVAMKGFAAILFVAYGAYRILIDAREKWEKAHGKFTTEETKRWAELNKQLGGWTEFAKAATKEIIKQTGAWKDYEKKFKEINDIWHEYGENTEETLRAIAEGKHGEDLKKFLEELGGEHLKAAQSAGVEAFSLEQLEEKIEDAIKAVNDAIEGKKDLVEETIKLAKAEQAWIDFMATSGMLTQEETAEKVKEITGLFNKLQERYKNGQIDQANYNKGMEALKEMMKLTSGELDIVHGKLWVLGEDYNALLPPMRDFVGLWEMISPKVVEVKEKFEEVAISLETVREVFNNVVLSMGENLLNWGNMTGNVLKNITTVFAGFIQEMIKGFGKLVIAQLMQAKKGILISKAEAIAKAIAKVFAKVPFPLNVVIAGTMFGVVGALFAKLMPKLEGGGWIPRPMLVEAGHGPKGEIIAQPAKLAEIIASEMPRVGSPEMGFAPATIQPIVNIYAQTLDRDTIDKAAEMIDAAIERQKKRRGY